MEARIREWEPPTGERDVPVREREPPTGESGGSVISGLGVDYQNALTAHVAAQVAAKSAREGKDDAKKALYSGIRSLVKIVQARPGLTDSQRAALGISIPKDSRTPVPPPTARPEPQIRDIAEFEHVLRIVDAETNKVAKPEGVGGVEVWMKVVPSGDAAPVDPDELEFAGYTTSSKYVQSFAGNEVGHTAYYRTRYLNTRGERGPWGNQIAATIAA